MDRAAKKELVTTLNGVFKSTNVVVVAHYSGLNVAQMQTLRKQMKTKGRTLYSIIDKSGRLDETQLEQDINSIREWYQDHGYIDVEVK